MKMVPKSPMPWDVAVFVTIATMGLGYTVQRASNRSVETYAVRSLAETEFTQQAAPLDNRKTIDLGCMSKKLSREHIFSDGGTVRFKGKFCHLSRRAMKRFEGVKIQNTSSANEATIFFQEDDTTFVTNFIPMVPGKNIVRVEWRESHEEPTHVFIAEVQKRE